MGVYDWAHDHAPERIQRWMDTRTRQKEADVQYEDYLQRKASGTETRMDRANFEPAPRSAELDAVERLSRVKVITQDQHQAQAYWQQVAEIGRQQTQAAKMTDKQTTTSEHTQKRTPRQAQT